MAQTFNKYRLHSESADVLVSLLREEQAVAETRKLAAILAADVVGYSRLAGSDEDRTLARLRGAAQRSDRPDHRRRINGRVVKRTGDGSHR